MLALWGSGECIMLVSVCRPRALKMSWTKWLRFGSRAFLKKYKLLWPQQEGHATTRAAATSTVVFEKPYKTTYFCRNYLCPCKTYENNNCCSQIDPAGWMAAWLLGCLLSGCWLSNLTSPCARDQASQGFREFHILRPRPCILLKPSSACSLHRV